MESGYQPRLDDVQHLPSVVGFNPTEGGVVADTGEIDRVRVRKETIDVLHMLREDHPSQSVDPEVLQRANRLLAHYLRHIIGSESAAMRWMWGSISS